jgi:parvulin-like peptidyl-prolyl isomerase
MNKKRKPMKRFLSVFLVAFILFSASCSKKKEEIVAQVNNETLTLSELKSNFNTEEWNNLSREKKNEFVQQWIRLTLLSQEADRTKISAEESVQQKIESAVKKIKSNALIALKFSEIKVSENELFNYYKLHKSNFQKKIKEYKIQRIFVKDKIKVDSVLIELKKGTKFTEAAKKYSEESLGRNGGYAGFFSPEQLGNEIWRKLSKLRKWQYTTVKTSKGFFIIRFYDTRIKTIEKTFFEVKEEIQKIVLNNKKEEVYRQLLEELKSKAEISVSI